MATLDAFIAQRKVNFNWLIGNYVDDITFTILNSDGDPFDFTGYTEITMRIYDNRTAKRVLIDTLTETLGDLSLSVNVITLDTAFPAGMTFGTYNYELDYTTATSEPIRLAEGYINVI